MGKDYKIGMASGSVVAVIALIWVATRPSLSPEARMLRSSQAAPSGSGVGLADRLPSQARGSAAAPETRGSLGSVIDSQQEDGGQQATHNDSPGPVAQAPAPNPQSAIRSPQSTAGPDLTIYERAEKIKTTRFHIVRKEDTLSAISRQYYGTPNGWKKILEANKRLIKDPSKLQPGTKLTIPD